VFGTQDRTEDSNGKASGESVVEPMVDHVSLFMVHPVVVQSPAQSKSSLINYSLSQWWLIMIIIVL